MQGIRRGVAVVGAMAGLLLASRVTPVRAQATQPPQQGQAAKPAPKHHSKIKGALVGGAVGAAVGHPKAGAAVGVLHQHHKNKKAKSGQ